MERELMLLGLLHRRELYGYQINEIIDTQVGSSIRLTKPTSYRILHKMNEQGLIAYTEEKQGNRPTRRIYSITPKGEEQLLKYLSESLSSYHPTENVNAIALGFLDLLPPSEITTLVHARLQQIEHLIESHLSDSSQSDEFQLIKENQILHLSAELAWLRDVIAE